MDTNIKAAYNIFVKSNRILGIYWDRRSQIEKRPSFD